MSAIVDLHLPLDTVSANCRLLPGNLTPECGPTLVVLLHGAVNRDKRSIPFHPPFFAGLPALWQLSVADPTMERFDTLAAGWYLGWKGEPLWESLGRAIRDKAAEIGAGRVLYVGGSSGGFAALLLSHLHPGSIALLRNPQVDMLRHVYGRASATYLRRAWDGVPEEYGVPADLTELYARGMENRVIYLQSPGDRKHVHVQAARFLSAIRGADQAKVIFDCRYHGIAGHGGSVPNAPLRAWIEAALAVPYDAPDWADQVLTHHFAATRPGTVSRPEAQRPVRVVDTADLALADRIARHYLEA